MTRTLVDTNILVYSIEKQEFDKHTKAVDIIDQLSKNNELVLSIQNLAEFSRVLLEKAKPAQEHDVVLDYMYRFLKFSEIIRYSEETITHAIQISKEYDLHFFDALLTATMQENSINQIITEDTTGFEKISWLKTTNPFK